MLLLVIVILCYGCHCTELFSGVYAPDTEGSGQAEDFGAAFLISKKRFQDSYQNIHSASNMAGVSFAVVRKRGKQYRTLMSRDYFDFMVEHLSTTSNQLPHQSLFPIYNQKIKQTALRLKKLAKSKPSWSIDPRLNQTVALLVYSSITFSRSQSQLQSKIREWFFAATFWSVHRYIPHIVIYVASDKDRLLVESMELSAYRVIQLQVPVDNKNRTVLLPRTSLEHAISSLGTQVDQISQGNNLEPKVVSAYHSEDWGDSVFGYVYFSEGDQILHMRQPTGLYNSLDFSKGNFLLVPHRMQTLPLMVSMRRKEFREHFRRNNHMAMENVTIVTERLEKSRGSCCDDGRLDIAECGRWWYQCPDWGLRELEPWLKFGRAGYTFPPATAHKGSCQYSPTKILCPMIAGCEHRVPPARDDTKGAHSSDVCMEFPKMRHMGPQKQ